QARPPAHHALRAGRLLQEPDLLGGRAAHRARRAGGAVSRAAAALALVLGLVGPSRGGGPADHPQVVRPEDLAYVYGVGRFVPESARPAPGTYRLPPIDDIADHPLLGSDGQPTALYALTGDRIAIVAFVYTSCADATGCPVSMGVLHHLDREIAGDAKLA